jgi:hypothetical protein
MSKELFSRDTTLKPKVTRELGLGIYGDPDLVAVDQTSWSSLPLGLLLLIKDTSESPNAGSEYYLLVDDNGNRLLIE